MPMRIGVNAGSLEREFAMKYGFPCPPAMVDSALRYIEIAESEGYHDIIVSLKSRDVMTAVEAYRLYAKHGRLPDAHRHHRGGQAALRGHQVGAPAWPRSCSTASATRSASACWATRCRRSRRRSTSCRRRSRRVRKPELIACPTCGRLEIDLEKIIAELEQRLDGRTTPIKISVLGCVVNGPGEAREADLGIAAGKGKGVIFRNGEIVRHVPGGGDGGRADGGDRQVGGGGRRRSCRRTTGRGGPAGGSCRSWRGEGVGYNAGSAAEGFGMARPKVRVQHFLTCRGGTRTWPHTFGPGCRW